VCGLDAFSGLFSAEMQEKTFLCCLPRRGEKTRTLEVEKARDAKTVIFDPRKFLGSVRKLKIDFFRMLTAHKHGALLRVYSNIKTKCKAELDETHYGSTRS
jgi:hypothetical protein